MTAVLYTPHFVQFFENDGVTPAAGGLLYSYAAGTTTPKATYTTAAGDTAHTNPIVLDSVGRATIFIMGAYKFILKDSDGNTIKTTDNITSFNASTETNEGFFQSFSGDASTVAFTLSESLGSDEKALEIFSELEYSTNGTFASDTGWTKGSGWTIAAGVATATGAISTALEQPAGIAIVQGCAYLVKCVITRSAGSITPNLGGTAGTARSADGTYSEIIIAGSTQTISFTTSGFTGTVDSVSVRNLGGMTVRDVGDYTVDGTSLVFAKAPATGTNNIQVRAPYTLIGAAGAAQVAADEALAAQAAAEGATNAVSYQFKFDDSTSMADPGTGDFRLNNATLASVTAIALDAASSVSGNPDVSDVIATWGASTNTVKGQIKISKSGTPATFAQYNVTAAVTDNTGWLQITVEHVASNGTLSAADVCYLQFTRSGDVGATGSQGPSGTVSGASSATAASDDKVLFLDTSASDGLAYDSALDVVASTLLDEDNMASDSATRAPTQQSVKAYIDGKDAADFGSGASTDGQVLTSDGAGGAAWEDIVSGSISIDTAQATTSGTSKSFTVPTGAVKVTISAANISATGTDVFKIQLNGQTSGYDGGVQDATNSLANSDGFNVLRSGVAASTYTFHVELTLVDSSTNQWMYTSICMREDLGGIYSTGGGTVTLSAALTSLAVMTSNTDTLDGGKVNCIYFVAS